MLNVKESEREFGSTYLTAGKAISSVYVSPPVCWRPWRPVSASSSSSLEIGVNEHKHIHITQSTQARRQNYRQYWSLGYLFYIGLSSRNLYTYF